MKSKLLKAEILLTRHCNLQCEYCGIVDNSRAVELDEEHWKKAFTNIIEVLGGKFIAIYGGEPMIKYNMLKNLLNFLSTNYPHVDHTVISNSVLLTQEKAEELMANGLKSWTVSADSIEGTNPRDNAGFRALEIFKKLGLRDLAVSITIHKKNVHTVADLVRHINELGYWALFDVIHTDKGGYTFAPKAEKIPDYVLTGEDASQLQVLAYELSRMYYEGKALIHQLPEFFNYLANPYYSIERNWICSYPAWITVDSNGHMMCCEDWTQPLTNSYNILDFVEERVWDRYVNDWKHDVKCGSGEHGPCKGCLWSGHLQSEIALKDEHGIDYFAHRQRGL
jgi:MoaA/NifB/PqqE/SkfB family radical SAM enzyme